MQIPCQARNLYKVLNFREHKSHKWFQFGTIVDEKVPNRNFVQKLPLALELVGQVALSLETPWPLF